MYLGKNVVKSMNLQKVDGVDSNRREHETVRIPPPDTEVVPISPEREAEVVHRPKKKRKKRKRTAEDGDIEEDHEAVSGDDCEVAGDEDCDDVGYADERNGNGEEGLGDVNEDAQWNIVSDDQWNIVSQP